MENVRNKAFLAGLGIGGGTGSIALAAATMMGAAAAAALTLGALGVVDEASIQAAGSHAAWSYYAFIPVLFWTVVGGLAKVATAAGVLVTAGLGFATAIFFGTGVGGLVAGTRVQRALQMHPEPPQAEQPALSVVG